MSLLNAGTISAEVIAFLDAAEKFSSLMTDDVNLLQTAKIEEIRHYFEEKNTVADACIQGMQSLLQEGILNNLPRSTLVTLKQNMGKLDAQLKKNLAQLEERQKHNANILNFFKRHQQGKLKGAFYTRTGMSQKTRPAFLSEAL